MQSLLARHGKCTVKDGPLAGTLYEAVAADRLRKAAKRYTGDSDFQKFARSFVLLEDLKESNMPEPCQPLAPKQCSDLAVVKGKTIREKAWKCFTCVCAWIVKYRYVSWTVAVLCLALMMRPKFARTIAKLSIGVLRLAMRRIMGFLFLLLEGLVDEVIYQIDFMIRDALPSGGPIADTATGISNLVSHLFSSSLGAGIAIIYGWRRALQPAHIPAQP